MSMPLVVVFFPLFWLFPKASSSHGTALPWWPHKYLKSQEKTSLTGQKIWEKWDHYIPKTAGWILIIFCFASQLHRKVSPSQHRGLKLREIGHFDQGNWEKGPLGAREYRGESQRGESCRRESPTFETNTSPELSSKLHVCGTGPKKHSNSFETEAALNHHSSPRLSPE